MMSNVFSFILKPFSVLKKFDIVGHVEKQLDKKAKLNFKIHGVVNYYKKHIV